MDFRIRTKLACRIAGLDPDRFNEAVAAGNYRCAPPTRPGSARLFQVVDVVVLRIYRELLDEGMPPIKAGQLACFLRIEMSPSSKVSRWICVKDDQGNVGWFPEDEAPQEIVPASGRPIISRREWRIGYLRELIMEELKKEVPALGEE